MLMEELKEEVESKEHWLLEATMHTLLPMQNIHNSWRKQNEATYQSDQVAAHIIMTAATK